MRSSGGLFAAASGPHDVTNRRIVPCLLRLSRPMPCSAPNPWR